jgi:DNA repair exonuclease SbcCD ATPase subunit
MHVVGVPVASGYKKGLSKQVSKTKVFTADRLSELQDKMRQKAEYGMNLEANKNLFEGFSINEKGEGRNFDIPKKSLDEYYKKINDLADLDMEYAITQDTYNDKITEMENRVHQEQSKLEDMAAQQKNAETKLKKLDNDYMSCSELYRMELKAQQSILDTTREASEQLARRNSSLEQQLKEKTDRVNELGGVIDVHEARLKLDRDVLELETEKTTLNVRKADLDALERNIEADREKVNHDVIMAKKMIDEAPQYYVELQQANKKNEELEQRCIDLENENDSLTDTYINKCAEHFDTCNELRQTQTELEKSQKNIQEQEKELSLMKRIVSCISKNIVDKIKRLFDLEEVIENPGGELSAKNRNISESYNFNECPYPYAEKSDEDWHYYWKGSNGNRADCLRRAYLPLAKNLQQEMGHADMCNQDLLAEAYDCQEKYQEMHHSRGHSR